MDNPQHKTGTGSILIVDGDQSASQTLSQLLEPEGYAIRCAPSGHTALLCLHKKRPQN